MCSRAKRTAASTTSSPVRETAFHGSAPAAKQDSDFQMLPIPAIVRWSSSASPKARVGSSSRIRRITSASSRCSPITSGPRAASCGSIRLRDSVSSSSSGPSNCTTSCPPARITSHARRGARRQRSPAACTAQAPLIRRCECSTRSPSKCSSRCLPRASTRRSARPARRSGQRSASWRRWGVRISSGTRPSSTARMRLAA